MNYRLYRADRVQEWKHWVARKARRQAAVSRFLPARRGDMVPHPPFSGLLDEGSIR